MLGDYQYNIFKKDEQGVELQFETNDSFQMFDFVLEYRTDPNKNQACTFLLLETTDVVDSHIDETGMVVNTITSIDFDEDMEEDEELDEDIIDGELVEEEQEKPIEKLSWIRV